uniref:Subunit 5 of NADH-plastoquinone oxidoreductase n=1 Tax=Palmophyllum crassum TaxID=1615899 RepID=A0A1L7NXY5_9VIRI|nr:subunit 5 of NADH-plastoquinone oxidoreductase [Palmophyllum crassum]BAW34780.1 subunit 5 of NADH-plastoquinone oxidoreductase [Palmophyllum crassum]
MTLFYQFAWCIPIFPLIASIIGALGLLIFRKATQVFHWRYAIICISCIFFGFIYSCFLFYYQSIDPQFYEYTYNWFDIGLKKIEIGYRIDSLSILMLIIVSSISLLVMIYSHGYMKYDKGYTRFFIYLSLFSSSMLGLVFSSNLLQIYFFWELIGMCSYLLIGFWSTRSSSGDASQKAFIVNRIGDFGLFLSILGFYWACNSFNSEEVIIKVQQILLNHSVSPILLKIFAFLLILGPLAKSAQIPFHIWLPDAMEGPTPISALIHAATLVAAGVFLIARFLPLLEQMPEVCLFISSIGALTAFIGATIALVQTDLKKGLAYSTISQLGYMFIALGIGNYSSALFHLLTHAYSKALLFLCAGSIIHGMEHVIGYNPTNSQNIFLMGGLKKFMPVTRFMFLIGTLSLCGVPPFSCFWSKDEILASTFPISPVFWFIGLITAGLTSFYMFRLYFLTFEGPFQLSQFKNSPKESNLIFLIPLILLSIPTIFLGVIQNPVNNLFANFLTEKLENTQLNEFFGNASASIFMTTLGFYFAYKFYKTGFLSSNYKTFKIQNFGIYNFINKKWFFDIYYQNIFICNFRKFCNKIFLFDNQIIDGLVTFISLINLIISEFLKTLITGQLRTYFMFLISSICFFNFFIK